MVRLLRGGLQPGADLARDVGLQVWKRHRVDHFAPEAEHQRLARLLLRQAPGPEVEDLLGDGGPSPINGNARKCMQW